MNRKMKTFGLLMILMTTTAQSVLANHSFWDAPQEVNCTIYPNPAVNMVNINYRASADYHIVISNILGTVVHKSQTISQFNENHIIRLMDLNVQSGIYLIKIYEGSTLKATKKLIVKRA